MSGLLCKIQKCVDTLKAQVADLQNASGDANTDEQTLSIAGDQLSISNGNTVTIGHPDQEICDGSFVQRSSRTGWAFPWTPVFTTNSGTITDDWVNVGSSEVAPDCVSDMAVSVFAGNHYFQNTRCRMYLWIDFRILVNGAAVFAETYDHYEYEDRRNATNPLEIIIKTGGPWFAERKGVPAGATVQVQMRRRYNFNAFLAGGRARLIGGLRSKAMFTFAPQQIVTGRQ